LDLPWSTPRMTRRIYADVAECRALIFDSNPTARSILVDMLRQMGVIHIQQAARVLDARKALEDRVFDIVLCDYHFDNPTPGSKEPTTSGQDLLDDLRRSQILPFSTVFIMVTAEASYHRVAEAAEAALDSYLIKPHTAAALEERLMQARHRKRVLKDIFSAIEEGEFEVAAGYCLRRFAARGEYWLYAARIGAELFLRLGKHKEARTLYESVQSTHAVPWAKLGIARAELDQNQLPQAKRTLESLIAAEPTYADAYDVMGRVLIEQGDMGSALDTFRQATAITPHSITRLQKQGMLAFFMGNHKEASDILQRSVRVGISSKMFDCQGLVLLCLTHYDLKENKDFQRGYDNLAKLVERNPGSGRLRRFRDVVGVFKSLNERRVADCVSLVKRLTAEIRNPDFDFEAANNMLAVLARLRVTEIQLPDSEIWVAQLADRFCVSKAATELLCKAAQNFEAYEALLRESQSRVSQMAEKAISRSVQGSPTEAVQTLVQAGQDSKNAKLIELAGLVLNRHRERIEGVDTLSEQIEELKAQYCKGGTQVNLGHSNARSAGGIQLRTRQAEPEAAPSATTEGPTAQTSDPQAETGTQGSEPDPWGDDLAASSTVVEISDESASLPLESGVLDDLSDPGTELDPWGGLPVQSAAAPPATKEVVEVLENPFTEPLI
jgi:CheY-like chemotaxis protein